MVDRENRTAGPGDSRQPDPLLKTKLFVPAPRPDLLPRLRLAERLDETLRPDHKLTLISAPAGFGKTTLLASWIAGFRKRTSERRPGSGNGEGIPECAVAWISLDPGDNEPARFLAYLVAAVQSFDPTLGEAIAGALRSPQPPAVETLLTALINELATVLASGGAPPRHYVLVLDDYHGIKAQPIHNAVAFLLDHLPPGLHLVIATRSDPPLPLARLRGRGQLTEVRVADLRFTPEEAAGFLNQVMAIGLSAEDVAALEERTEGWITGLQLAALSLRGRDREHVSGFIHEFAGSNRFVLDYLVEEVLQQQTGWLQSFLLQTSILKRLSGPLCKAVTGRDDAQSILESLERANLFILPLDATRQWYRYHHLFADLLHARLNQPAFRPDIAPEAELHRRASEWYEQHGFIAEAISHALAGQDQERAADLIEANGTAMLMRGELTTLLGWLAALPEESIRARPWLCIYHAWGLLLSGRLDAVEPRLKDAAAAADAVGAGGEGSIQGHSAAIRAYLAGISGHRLPAIELARQALQLLPEEELAVRAVVSYTLGGTSLLAGDVAGASQAFAEAGTLGHRSGNLHVAVPALCTTADLLVEQGRLGRAAERYREALRWAVGSSGKRLPIAAPALSGLGQVLYEWNDRESAAQHLKQSVELGSRWGNLESLASDYGALAWVLQSQGHHLEAYRTLQEAETLVQERRGPPLAMTRLAAYRARLDVAQGQLSAAAAWAREYETSAGGTFDFLHEFENLALARVLLARGEMGRATSLLAQRLEAAEDSGRVGRVIEILALQALIRQAQKDTAGAMALLERALLLAEPEDYLRTFVDEGAPMARLLLALGQTSSAVGRDYLSRLSATSGQPARVEEQAIDHGPAPLSSPAQLVEPLSERELEVLHLVAAGLTNREIAERLVIAVSTVKSHTNSIYGKLDVRNRTQAIARAQALGLL